jgi:glutamate decarboxylase
MINSDDYPQTAEIENRCFNMISRLFHAPDEGAGALSTFSREPASLGSVS